MNKLDIDALEKLANNATVNSGNERWLTFQIAFEKGAKPEVVLDLIKRVRAAEAELARMREQGDPRINEVLHTAVAAIYFNDSSDYLPSLFSIVRCISPRIADLLSSDEEAAFDETASLSAIANNAPAIPAEPRPAVLPEWTNAQCLEFITIAFRHAEISGDITMDDIRLGMKMVNAGGEVEE